jgi:hypothetical protein
LGRAEDASFDDEEEADDDVVARANYAMDASPCAWTNDAPGPPPGGVTNTTAARLQASAAKVAAAQARSFFSPNAPLDRKAFATPQGADGGRRGVATPRGGLASPAEEDASVRSAPSSLNPSLNSPLSTHTAHTPQRPLHPAAAAAAAAASHAASFRVALALPEFSLDPTLKPDVYVTQELARRQLLARRGAKLCAEQFANFKALQTIGEDNATPMTAALFKLGPVISERAKREGSQVPKTLGKWARPCLGERRAHA